MLDIEPRHLSLALEILHRHLPTGTKIYAFGSKVKGTARKNSDLDLVIKYTAKIDFEIMAKVRFDLEMSTLPYKVDVLDWLDIPDNFKQNIENDLSLIK